MFNGLRYIVHTGMQWRMMPNDLPPWYTVYQQTQRWVKAKVFETLVHDLRMLLREIAERSPQPSSTGARCSRRPRVARVRVRMGTSGAKGRRYIWRWTRWGTCWPRS